MSDLALLGGPKTVTLAAPMWPRLTEEDIAAIHQALEASRDDSRYLSAPAGGGPVGAFEAALSAVFGVGHALTMSSGGAALHTAVMAAGVEAGDEVIVSPYTWGQTVSCILQQNAIPVFADIEPDFYGLDARSVEAAVTSRTRAVVVVHLYGHPADMDPIMDVARRHGLRVIEDCAQATGAAYKGRRVGTIGDFGCFSIGDGKQIVGGEGGFLLTADDALYDRALFCSQHPARLSHELRDEGLRADIDSLIYTYRIHPLAAVICRSQLPHLDEWNAQRRRNHDLLSAGLAGVAGIRPVAVRDGCAHVYHQYSPSFVPEAVEGVSRQTFVRALQAEGVPAGLGYVRNPIHLRPAMQQRRSFYGRGYPWRAGEREVRYAAGDCPTAEARCATYELSLAGGPSWLGDQSALVEQIVAACRKVDRNLDELRAQERSRAQAAV